MADTLIGIMQGRLSPPEDGRFQSFPRNSWQEEFLRAREAGLDYIEWIYDHYGSSVNPIATELGVSELNKLKVEYGIDTPAVCADWLMDFPLVRCTEEERVQREQVLHWLLRQASKIGASRIVLPFVDASSIRSGERTIYCGRRSRKGPSVSEETGVEMHLEADFNPAGFARFLARIPHAMIKVNYDTGNSSGLGYNPREEFAAYGERIGSIHIKDRLRKSVAPSKASLWARGAQILRMSLHAFVRSATRADFTLQVARGKDGDEVNWARQQIAFIRHFRN